MEKSLCDLLYQEVLGEPSPIPDGHPESMTSEQEINELVQWLIEPCEGNESYDLPSCTYAPDCSEQEINLIMQWLLEPCQGPEIPACSPECPSSLELPPAKTWAVPSETEQVQEESAEPADQKKRGQGRKRKSEDEKPLKKRCRTEPKESCNMANLLTMPHPTNLFTAPHLVNVSTVPHQTYLPTVPHLTNPASSEGRKRKLEGEKLPKKRFRRDLKECCGMANLHTVPHLANLVTVPHHAIMPTLPHQANFTNLPTVPYLANLPTVPYPVNLANLPTVPHQVNLGNVPMVPHQVNLGNVPTVPHQAKPVSDTSTPVPPLQTVIPNYVITYTEVGSMEQRERYVQDCRAAFHEANILYWQIGQYLGPLLNLDRQLKQLVPGSEPYKKLSDLIKNEFQAVVQVRPSYIDEANRFLYLDGKQIHILRLLAEFDQSCGLSGF